MYQVKLIENSEDWENFVKKQPHTLFVQSYLYGEFYRTLGEKYWILGVYKDNVLAGGALAVSTHAKRANFLYIPYGPIIDYASAEQLEILTMTLGNLARTEKLDFIRVSPFISDTPEHAAVFQSQGFRPAPMHILAETTWLLNIGRSEEELLAGMEKHHRNFIRRCVRAEVEIVGEGGESLLDNFFSVYDYTAKRHGFHPFSHKYIAEEFFTFANENMAMLWQCFAPERRLDAAAIVMYYGNMACYRHGASFGVDKYLPTSYFLQWKAILEAKRRGMMWYNFWGIAPEGATRRHPFYGITHFKKGFGGQALNLIPCQDLPLSSRYWINFCVETARRIKRGF